jgi:hypothetical protein
VKGVNMIDIDKEEIAMNEPLRKYEFTEVEVRALWRILAHHYIHYEDTEAINVVRKISKIVEKHELDK